MRRILLPLVAVALAIGTALYANAWLEGERRAVLAQVTPVTVADDPEYIEVLVVAERVHAAIDLSDGLGKDVRALVPPDCRLVLEIGGNQVFGGDLGHWVFSSSTKGHFFRTMRFLSA